jgi:SAM-dependent methyltransferase
MKYKGKRLDPPPLPPRQHPPDSRILAGMWNDFVNAKKRMESEGPFLLRHLSSHKNVFDAALGTGADSIFLLDKGYAVTGNEIDRHFRTIAMKNLRQANLFMPITKYDWLNLDAKTEKGSFDAVLCLGNSLTYLFERYAQFRALSNFAKILKDGGVLILDVRNYEYMLENQRDILTNGGFRYSGNYVYCGIDSVHAKPVAISDSEITMEYEHITTRKKAYLYLYPFRLTELHGLLAVAGFSVIRVFSDYVPGLDRDADFYQFVRTRPKPPKS